MLRVAIVDDEQHIANGLAANVNWKALGIDEVAAYSSARDVLNNTLPIDILVTDIRMPEITGIQLAERISATNPNCKIVFMSAYSDREFYRSAIQLHAVGFIEKPIIISEVNSVIREAVKLCLVDRNNRDNEKYAKLAVKEEFCKDVVDNSLTDFSLKKYRNYLDGLLSMYNYTLILVKLREGVFNKTRASDLNDILYREYHEIFEQCCCVVLTSDELLIIVGSLSKLTERQCKYASEKILSGMPETNNLFISVGRVIDSPHKLHNSYLSANSAMRLLFFLGYGKVASNEQYMSNPKRKFEINDDLLIYLEEMARTGKYDDFKAKFRNIFFDSLSCYGSSSQEIKQEYFSVIRIMYSIKQSFTGNTEDMYSLWKDIDNVETIIGLRDLVSLYIQNCFDIFEDYNKYGEKICLAIQYINANLENPKLSVSEIAGYVHFRDTYLISQFKKKTGTTINKYIIDARMKQAKYLLKSTNYTERDIAVQVGYTDLSYFIKSFRKYSGMTPAEYRSHI